MKPFEAPQRSVKIKIKFILPPRPGSEQKRLKVINLVGGSYQHLPKNYFF